MFAACELFPAAKPFPRNLAQFLGIFSRIFEFINNESLFVELNICMFNISRDVTLEFEKNMFKAGFELVTKYCKSNFDSQKLFRIKTLDKKE